MKKQKVLDSFDDLNGYEFEDYLKKLFSLLGYNVNRTAFSGDQGADLVIESSEKKIVVQAKNQKGPVGNKAIQEIVAAKKHYDANNMLVVCTSTYTESAIELAKSNNVELWDRQKLKEVIAAINSGAEQNSK